MRNPFALPVEIPFALPLKEIGYHEPGAYCWEDWEADMKKAYPVRFFLSRILPRKLGRLKQVIWKTPLYWLRTHTIHRYHIVDLRNPLYKWGWVDRSEAVFYACFVLLTDFVENELPHGCVDWDYDDYYKGVRAEIQALYDWWKTGRKAAHDAHHERMNKEWSDAGEERRHELCLESSRLDEVDEEMLHRLVKIRGYFWT